MSAFRVGGRPRRADVRERDFEHDLALMADELEHRERELDRYRAALVRIANAESGYWGVIAHEALHPPEADT